MMMRGRLYILALVTVFYILVTYVIAELLDPRMGTLPRFAMALVLALLFSHYSEKGLLHIMSRPYALRARADKEEEPEEEPPARAPAPEVHVSDWVVTAAEYTAPNVSLVFLLIFAAAAYFHETHVYATYVGMGVWVLLQALNRVLSQEDIRNDLFWSVLGALGQILIYLLIGAVWIQAKLYLDIRLEHLPAHLDAQISTCFSKQGEQGCYLAFLMDMKLLAVHWMLTWPISMAYTFSRDPLHLATDMAFEMSRARLISVIQHAMAARSNDSTLSEQWLLLWWVATVAGYLVVGYLWTHLKLFIDVWQARLPRALDNELREVYHKKLSYWTFVRNAKWIIIKWIFTWPFSVVHTVLRDPFRIVAEFVYKLSQRKYVAITAKAMEWREQKQAEMEE